MVPTPLPTPAPAQLFVVSNPVATLYLIAQGLASNKSADAVLVSPFKNGKMAKMAESNWKP